MVMVAVAVVGSHTSTKVKFSSQSELMSLTVTSLVWLKLTVLFLLKINSATFFFISACLFTP